MDFRIDDELIESIAILSKLELSQEDKELAKKDLGRMLDYIDCLKEVDTEGMEPLRHVFPVCNVFREDKVCTFGDEDKILENAPRKKNGMFVVPAALDSAGEG